jgi:hypothetical protein
MAGRIGLVAVAVAAACGGGSGGGGVEKEIAEGLARELGVPVGRVRCPAGPYPKRCTAEVAGSEPIEVRAAEALDGKGVDWSIEGFVISTRPLAAEIGLELDDLGVEAKVDCGPTYVTTAVGQRVACTLELVDGRRGAAWARIVDDDGTFALELALDEAAVGARTATVEDAELDRLSRALDVDDVLGDDDEQAPRDAGVDAPAAVAP